MAKVHLTPKAAQKLTSIVEQVERSSDTLLQGSLRDAPPQRMQLGVIVENGPNGEDDFEDARYWVQSAFVSNDTDDPDEPAAVSVYEPDRPGRFAIRPVTNLGEIDDQSHGLDPGTIVRTWHQPDRSETPAPIRRWLMNVLDGSAKFCIVRSIPNPEVHTLMVQRVRHRDGEWRTHGNAIERDTYPVMRAKFYAGLVVPGSGEQVVNQGWATLELKGRIVHPWTKDITLAITHADGLRADDCSPMTGIQRP